MSVKVKLCIYKVPLLDDKQGLGRFRIVFRANAKRQEKIPNKFPTRSDLSNSDQFLKLSRIK